MANRQPRNPGAIQQFDGYGHIGGVPDFAVDSGQAFDALARVAGGLSAKLGKLADEATAQQGALDGLNAGAQSGAAYLKLQATQNAAAARAGQLSPQISDVVTQAALRHGVDPAYLKRVAVIESSGNPNAVNKDSGAAGLFQFIPGTAKQYGLNDPTNVEASADAAARLTASNAAYLRNALGRDPTLGELYLAHQQGAGGAAALLSNPTGAASSVVGESAVTQNGGNGSMTAGQFANLWTKRFADLDSGTPATGPVAPGSSSSAALPVLSTTPLALKNDNTIYGEAFNRSARNAEAWRMSAGLETEMQAAYQANQDNPGALADALAKVHDQFSQDPNLADPQIREAFDKGFVQRSQAYLLDAQSKATARMRQNEREAAFEGIAAQRQAIQQQAMALGANPAGDPIMQQSVDRAGKAIDAGVASGTLTGEEGAALKQKLATTAAAARIQGTFEALPTPEAKADYAQGILKDWTSGKGPLAKLPYNTVNALSQTLWNKAQAEKNRLKVENRAEAARVSGLIKDDVTSMATTGQGLDMDANNFSPEKVSDLLGPAALAKWQAERATAAKGFAATNGMDTDTPEEISSRLLALQPQAGSAGFAEDEKIYLAAQKKAKTILSARAKDPAAAVDAAFPAVKQLADTASAESPDSMQALVAARLQAQEALGIPELGRDPLTVKEATALARAVTAEPDPVKQSKAMKDLAGQVQAVYGPHADAVMRQILAVKGIDRETSAYGAQIFRRLNDADRPTAADRRQGAVVSETAAADASAAPKAADAFPLPNYRQQQMLLHPELSAQFDQKFGAGAAKKVLGMKPTNLILKEDGGTTVLAPDGSESWTPDK